MMCCAGKTEENIQTKIGDLGESLHVEQGRGTSDAEYLDGDLLEGLVRSTLRPLLVLQATCIEQISSHVLVNLEGVVDVSSIPRCLDASPSIPPVSQ